MEGSAPERAPSESAGDKTTCRIVGGGPAGAVLGLLLARQGVDVTLLEAHHDFDRDFRGDTVHPSTLAALGQIGLAEGLLKIPHSRMTEFRLQTPHGTMTLGRFSGLKTPYPFVALMPQVHFIEYLVEEAGAYSNFHLRLSARANELKSGAAPGAHTMSPVGGVGINYAIQDALAAANLLTAKLLAGRVDDADLAAVQRRREGPTHIIQALQRRIAGGIVGPALGRGAFKAPLLARIPMLRAFFVRIVGLGARPERVAPASIAPRAARKTA